MREALDLQRENSHRDCRGADNRGGRDDEEACAVTRGPVRRKRVRHAAGGLGAAATTRRSAAAARNRDLCREGGVECHGDAARRGRARGARCGRAGGDGEGEGSDIDTGLAARLLVLCKVGKRRQEEKRALLIRRDAPFMLS